MLIAIFFAFVAWVAARFYFRYRETQIKRAGTHALWRKCGIDEETIRRISRIQDGWW